MSYTSWIPYLPQLFDSLEPLRVAELDEARRLWGAGPWEEEPDRFEAVDRATGYRILILRHEIGFLRGYLELPSEHRYARLTAAQCPCHGETVPDCPWQLGRAFPWPRDLDHTDYAQAGPGLLRIRSRRHLISEPYPWWVGFAMCHAQDVTPALARRLPWQEELPEVRYRDVPTVLLHLHRLGVALKAAHEQGPDRDRVATLRLPTRPSREVRYVEDPVPDLRPTGNDPPAASDRVSLNTRLREISQQLVSATRLSAEQRGLTPSVEGLPPSSTPPLDPRIHRRLRLRVEE